MVRRPSFDIEKQMLKHMALALGLMGGVMVLVWSSALEQAFVTAGMAESFAVRWLQTMSGFVLLGAAAAAVGYPILLRPKVLMRYAHAGYAVKWSLRPRRWFGRTTYTLHRLDALRGFGVRSGTSATGFYIDSRLTKRQKAQREMQCTTCRTDVKKNSVKDNFNRVAYFIEHRTRLYLFGIPLPFLGGIQTVDAYCSAHPPNEWNDDAFSE